MDGRGGLSRRALLKWSGSAGMLAVAAVVTDGCTPPVPGGGDANGLVLQPGFTSRVIARGGQVVPGTSHEFRIFPDGAATYPDPATPGGWIHCVNHEVSGGSGGVTAIRFAPDGTVLSATPILVGTSSNCAGGRTPWGTWLSCEEYDLGRVWECDPTGATPQVQRPAMGAFQHEAAAVADDGRVYLTEDKGDGAFYRFTPVAPGDLSDGLLEVAVGSAPGTVSWVEVPDPSASFVPCRNQVPGTARFDGGEGIDTLGTSVWFTTKGDDRVWHYDTATSQVSIRYQAGGSSDLSGVDNLLVDPSTANLFVAEDGGNMEIVMLRPDNTTLPVVRILGHEGSEVTGPSFSPDGSRLYFSSQRGPAGASGGLPFGVLYEVTGDWDALLGRP